MSADPGTALAHPLSGELLDADDEAALAAALEESEAALRERRGRLRPVYDARDALTSRLAELRGPAELPPPRMRSAIQQRVAECPRCRGKLAGHVLLARDEYERLLEAAGEAA